MLELNYLECEVLIKALNKEIKLNIKKDGDYCDFMRLINLRDDIKKIQNKFIKERR